MTLDAKKITEVLGPGWKKATPTRSGDLKAIKEADIQDVRCTGKARHKTKEGAMAEARIGHDYLEAYLCHHCGYYHVGKNREKHKITKRNYRGKRHISKGDV